MTSKVQIVSAAENDPALEVVVTQREGVKTLAPGQSVELDVFEVGTATIAERPAPEVLPAEPKAANGSGGAA